MAGPPGGFTSPSPPGQRSQQSLSWEALARARLHNQGAEVPEARPGPPPDTQPGMRTTFTADSGRPSNLGLGLCPVGALGEAGGVCPPWSPIYPCL